MGSLGLGERGWRQATWAVYALGAALQLWLWARPVWVYRDQLELYTLGMDLVRDGRLAPFGKLMTGDFPLPGGLLQLLVGLPLLVWRDLRSPTLLLVAVHLAAGWLLARVAARRYGWRAAALFLAVCWLSPWRLYHSGFLWEASYLLLPAALHLWACDALDRQPRRAAPSLVLGLTLAATAQVHGSVLILLFATAWLAWRRRVRLHLAATGAGLVLGSVTLWPTLLALLQGAVPPPSTAEPLGLLARANSVEKAVVYWLRLGSLDVGRRFRQTIFCEAPGVEGVAQPFACGLTRLTEVVALLSVLAALAASWWLLRRRHPAGAEPPPHPWARSYCRVMLTSCLAAALISPVLIQGWHVLIALPAACLPVALWTAARWPTARPWLRWAMALFLLWRLPAAAVLGLGHPMYVTPPDPAMRRHVVPEELLELDRAGRVPAEPAPLESPPEEIWRT